MGTREDSPDCLSGTSKDTGLLPSALSHSAPDTLFFLLELCRHNLLEPRFHSFSCPGLFSHLLQGSPYQTASDWRSLVKQKPISIILYFLIMRVFFLELSIRPIIFVLLIISLPAQAPRGQDFVLFTVVFSFLEQPG